MLFQFKVSMKQITTFGFQAAVLKWRGSSTRARMGSLCCCWIAPASKRNPNNCCFVMQPKVFVGIVCFWFFFSIFSNLTFLEVVKKTQPLERDLRSFGKLFGLIFVDDFWDSMIPARSVQLLDLVCGAQKPVAPWCYSQVGHLWRNWRWEVDEVGKSRAMCWKKEGTWN